jgi:hypothetical protein
LPGSSDDVVIPANVALTHSQGTDTINSITTGSGDALTAYGGKLTINSHSVIDPSFNLSIGGGWLSFNAAVPDTLTLASLTIGASGVLDGNDNFIVTGAFNWSSSYLIGPAGSFLKAQNGMNIGNAYVGGRTLINPAGQTATLQSSLSIRQGAVLDNEGQLNVTGPCTLGAAPSLPAGEVAPSVINNGNIDVNGSGGQGAGLAVLATLNSPGNIQVDQGDLYLGLYYPYTSLQATISGSLTVTNNASTVYSYEPTTFTASSTVNATNVIFGYGSVATIAASYSAQNTTVIFNGSATFTGDAAHGTAPAVGALSVGSGNGYYASAIFSPAVPDTVTLASLTIGGGGTLNGNDNFIVNGPFTWSTTYLPAVLSGPVGSSLTAKGSVSMSGAGYGLFLDGRTLVNSAVQPATLASSLRMQLGAVFDNEGQLDVTGPCNLGAYLALPAGETAPSVINNGNIDVNVPGGQGYGLSVLATLSSPGNIQVDQGDLDLGLYYPYASAQATLSGTLKVTNNASTVHSYEPTLFTASSTINATNVVFGYGSVATIAGSYSAQNTTVAGGSVTFTGDAAHGNALVLGALTVGIDNGWDSSATFSPAVPETLTLGSLTIADGGTLDGSDNFVVSGPFTWANYHRPAILSGPLGSSLTANGSLYMSSAGSGIFLYGRTLINDASATWAGGNVGVSNGASFINAATGTFNDTVDGGFGGGGCPTFTNQGLFLKSGGTGTTFLEMDLFNSGTVQVQQGVLDVSCGYVQGSGGSISGPVSGGISNPGTYNSAPSSNPPALLTSYTQTSTGTLYEQIGGLIPGTQYGQIIVNGNVNLDGSLKVAIINNPITHLPFAPQGGNQFIIIDNQGANPVNGTFGNLPEGATVWDTTHTYRFTISYVGGEGNDVVLTAQQTATSTTVIASANPAVLNQPVTFTANVTPAAGNGIPTGTVQFQIDNVNSGSPVTLSGGSASFSTATLTVGAHTITALYGGDGGFLGSSGSMTETVLSAQGEIALLIQEVKALVNAGVLNSGNGNALIAKLNSATASLNAGNTSAGVNQLNAFINQLSAFQKAGKLSSAQAQLLISGANLAINAVQGSGARLLNDSAAGTSSTGDTQPVTDAGQLVTGVIGVYLDNADGTTVPADEQARFDDAINALDATFAAYGVDLVDVGAADAAGAIVQVEIAGTSPAGGAAEGVLGCTVAGQITLLTGWDWYTGADPSAIGAGQYDFQTIVTHELGHAVGLGHSGDSGSVMYAYLAAGETRRSVTAQDLSVLDSGGGTPEPLTAAPWRVRATVPSPSNGSAAVPPPSFRQVNVTIPSAESAILGRNGETSPTAPSGGSAVVPATTGVAGPPTAVFNIAAGSVGSGVVSCGGGQDDFLEAPTVWPWLSGDEPACVLPAPGLVCSEAIGQALYQAVGGVWMPDSRKMELIPFCPGDGVLPAEVIDTLFVDEEVTFLPLSTPEKDIPLSSAAAAAVALDWSCVGVLAALYPVMDGPWRHAGSGKSGQRNPWKTRAIP